MSRLFCVVCAFAILLPSAATAQRRLLEQMLQELVESQIERPRQPPPAAPVVVGGPGYDVDALCGRLGEFSVEADGLADALRSEIRRDTSLAPLMVQTLRVKSRADLLRRKYRQPQPSLVILADLKRLDQEWRDVSFRLSAARGLPKACREAVGRLDRICAACVSPLKVTPQVDRRETARLATSLAAELHHLERDVEFEVRSPRKARRLLIAVQRAEGLAKLVGESALAGDPTPVVVDAYRQFAAAWLPLSGELYGLGDRHVTRTLGEVAELAGALRACLRIEASLDRGRVLSLAKAAQASFAEAYGGVTLAALLERPDSPDLIAAAQQLNRATNALCECAAGTADDAELLRRWAGLESAWQRYDTLYRPLGGRRREACVTCVAALREALGSPAVVGFDRRAVTRAAAELAAIAAEAQHRVAIWRARPGSRLEAGLIRSVEKMLADCRGLHERCAGSASPAELARDCRVIAQQWSAMRPLLLRSDSVDQRVLRRLANDGTAHLVRLQAMLDGAAGT